MSPGTHSTCAHFEAVVRAADRERDLAHRLLRRDLPGLLLDRVVRRDEEPVLAVGCRPGFGAESRAGERLAGAFRGIAIWDI